MQERHETKRTSIQRLFRKLRLSQYVLLSIDILEVRIRESWNCLHSSFVYATEGLLTSCNFMINQNFTLEFHDLIIRAKIQKFPEIRIDSIYRKIWVLYVATSLKNKNDLPFVTSFKWHVRFKIIFWLKRIGSNCRNWTDCTKVRFIIHLLVSIKKRRTLLCYLCLWKSTGRANII